MATAPLKTPPVVTAQTDPFGALSAQNEAAFGKLQAGLKTDWGSLMQKAMAQLRYLDSFGTETPTTTGTAATVAQADPAKKDPVMTAGLLGALSEESATKDKLFGSEPLGANVSQYLGKGYSVYGPKP